MSELTNTNKMSGITKRNQINELTKIEPTRQPYTLERRLKRKILRQLERIKEDWKIVYTELDGCDEYGSLYWATCANEWMGRSWEVSDKYYSAINIYKKKLVEEGIEYNNVRYFMRDDAYFCRIDKDYRIPFISSELHEELYSENMRRIELLVELELAKKDQKIKKLRKQIREMDETDYCYYTKKIDLRRMVRDFRLYEQKIIEIPYTSIESYDNARKIFNL